MGISYYGPECTEGVVEVWEGCSKVRGVREFKVWLWVWSEYLTREVCLQVSYGGGIALVWYTFVVTVL